MAVVLGLVQGVAEFLPISSSGHLSLLQHFFGMPEPDQLYNILLHFATLIAVCVVYRQDIVDMVTEFFRWITALCTRQGGQERGKPPEARRMILLLILGTLPLFLVLPFDDLVEGMGTNPMFVSLMLLLTGCILFLSDSYGGGKKTARTATVQDVLLVGLAQGMATIPGLSRSGTTISAGMALGFERSFAVRFSFLLSLPAVLGATLLKVVKVAKAGGVDAKLLPMYLVGMVIAGVVGYFAISLVKLLADKGKFGKFAYYCWAVGGIALIASFFFTTPIPA
ncbi:MAG: undecaprenyl-diphosphate phosphatase [Oscillospiraceae bacterium]|nr:undecaprenyl-diphosphate phosphatase [Oscillospiraceae bacterium]